MQQETIDVFIDCETLGTGPKPVILSIGVCPILNGMVLTDQRSTLYHVLKTEPQIREGHSVDVRTVEWWMKQDEVARKHVFDIDNDQKMHPLDFCVELSDYLEKCYRKVGKDNVKVWGNGALADNLWVRSLFASFLGKEPWEFWQDRCYRTIRAENRDAFDAVQVHPGIPHHALSDAIAEAETLAAFRNLKVKAA